jgi:hypothetical protein
MSNEEYLIVSYFTVALLAMALGLGVYLRLRGPFSGIVKAMPAPSLHQVLRRFLPVGILLPALIGFLSVSYTSCNVETYSKVVESRAYLIQKNREQIAAIANYLAGAVLIWGVAALLLLLLTRWKPDGQLGPRNRDASLRSA